MFRRWGLPQGRGLFWVSGHTQPSPWLAITVPTGEAEVEGSAPLLTLVCPQHGFETATPGSAGEAQVALPQGESVLLVQHDEIWEIRLMFRPDGWDI